jgi:hypothetical protein
MTWFTENPLPPVVIGIIVEAALVVGLAKTGKRGFLWGIVGTLAIVIAAVVTERMVVTPREAVTSAIEEMRAALAANDRATLLTHIDPGNVRLRNQVQFDLAQVTVSQAKINELKVEVDETGKIAVADIKGVVHFEGTLVRAVPVKIRAQLKKREPDGKWVVTHADYETARSPADI